MLRHRRRHVFLQLPFLLPSHFSNKTAKGKNHETFSKLVVLGKKKTLPFDVTGPMNKISCCRMPSYYRWNNNGQASLSSLANVR